MFELGPWVAASYPGMDLVRELQEVGGALTGIAEAITFLGDEEFYLLVFPLLYWSVRRRLGTEIGVMLLVSAGLNEVLKLAFHTPRPNFLAPELGLRHETSFGLPSGHSQNAVAVWGLLAARLRSRWWWLAAGVLIAALGWSRIQLGVHFLHDTLVGFAVGALLLAAFLRWRDPVVERFAAMRAGQRVWVLFGASQLLIGLGVLARVVLTPETVPASWTGIDPAEPPWSLAGVVTPAAALFGFGAGLVLVAERGGFDVGGAVWRRALRYPLGLVGVIVIWGGLDAAFPDGHDAVALSLRYLRYALTGLWIGGLAPLMFVRVGLAGRGGEDGDAAAAV